MTHAPALKLLATPKRPALLEGADAELDVLIRLQAPPAPDAGTRTPLDLALVLDRSSSMSGEPLAEAKRCAAQIVDHLGPRDRVAIVSYDDQVAVDWTSAPVTDREAVKRAIAGIETRGTTALHAGWLKGAEQIAGAVSPGVISRVLLLSDGCANVGLTDPDQIADQAARLRQAGVSTSTYGLGPHFDESLMTALAVSGGGNAYYGKTAKDLLAHFQEEFDLLSALCARDVRLTVSPSQGVLVEMLNDAPKEGAGWRLSDLAYGAEAWALIRARIAAAQVSALDGLALMEIAVAARDLDGRAISTAPVELALPSRTSAAFAALPEDPLVTRRGQELEAARLQAEAKLAARRHDWEAVEGCLSQAETAAADNEYVAAGLGALRRYAAERDEARFSREASYKALKMQTRLSSAFEGRRFSADSEAKIPSFLRRRTEEGVRTSDDGAPRARGSKRPKAG